MAISPSISARFCEWRASELAAHYASPCPDDVMNQLICQVEDAADRLAEHPATNIDELLVKLFPLVLANFRPAGHGAHPMVPASGDANGSDVLFESVLEDLKRLSPPIILETMAVPNPYDQ